MLTHLNEGSENPIRIVLLGGNGFIGKELSLLLEKKAIPCVSLSSADVDLTKESSVDKLVSLLDEKDSVIFLSALTPDKGRGLGAFEKNIDMGINVLKALEIKPVSHLIYFSSDAIYSMNESLVSEETIPNPEDLYGLMHLTRGRMMQFSFKNTAVVRPTLVYGVGDTHNSYGPNRFRRMAQEKKEITLFGGGEEKRDHIFVEDLVNLVVEILMHKSVGEINAVTGRSISYFDLAKMVGSLSEDVKITVTDRKNPITHRHFDNTAVFKSFPDFEFVSLEKGLERVHEEVIEVESVL